MFNKKAIVVVAIYTAIVIIIVFLLDCRLQQPININVTVGATTPANVEVATPGNASVVKSNTADTAASTEEAAVTSTEEPAAISVEDEYQDLRRLDEKFLTKDDDFRWPNVVEDLTHSYEDYRLLLDSEKLKNAKPGDTVAEWSYLNNDEAIDRIVVSVPKIYSYGSYSNALNKYGVLELFCYSQDGGQYEAWHAKAELFIYDKNALDDHQIIIQSSFLGTYTDSAYLKSSIPALCCDYSSTDFATEEEALAATTYQVEYAYTHFASNEWNVGNYEGESKFTENTIDFEKGELDAVLKLADQCNILGRRPIADYYNQNGEIYDEEVNKYVLGADNFDLTEFCNEISGPIAGKYELRYGHKNFIYFYPSGRKDCVIAVNGDRIYVGLSANDTITSKDDDVAKDRLYVGTYYVDKDISPTTYQIDGDRTYSITSNTLEQLLYLITRANINWSVTNAHNFGLNG